MTTQKSQKISDIQIVQRMQRSEQISHVDISRQHRRWAWRSRGGWLGEHRMSDSRKMYAEQWHFQPSSLWFREEQQFPRKISSRGSFPRVGASVSTNGLRSLLLGSKRMSNKAAAEGANSGSWEGSQRRGLGKSTGLPGSRPLSIPNCPAQQEAGICVYSDPTFIQHLICGGHQAKGWLLINFV